jgi:hypothetical protein
MRIISASRRTDIPAFYHEWIISRIKNGYCLWKNPFGGQIYRVPLTIDEVILFVFWSRDYGNFITPMQELFEKDYEFYGHFTINSYPKSLDPYVPSTEVAIEQFSKLAKQYGPHKFHWRYDPIMLTTKTDRKFQLRNFENLCKKLKGKTRRCYFSFTTFYKKTNQNLARAASKYNFLYWEPDPEEKIDISRSLAQIAENYGIEMYSCCDESLTGKNIVKAQCVNINGYEFRKKIGPLNKKHKPTREGCGCIESTDIGAYDTCPHGCAYCYSNTSVEKALKKLGTHQSKSLIL